MKAFIYSLCVLVSLLVAVSMKVSAFSVSNGLKKSTIIAPFRTRGTSSITPSTLVFLAKTTPDDFPDFPPPEEQSEEYTGSVDWDAEWKKVVKSQNKSTKRPGSDFYKSEAEIAAIKTANKAQESLLSAASKVSDTVPTWNSIKGDWKFWIGVLAVISVGLSLISASGQTGYSGGGDSLYI